ncbi:MAG: DoxX family protein [Bacteroidota bacterium]|nr:DoxX family protein [Bacteroidota bacterium]MDP4245405.1 DoxX family protein [Bacteroidota bacterium]MDP4254209.1 DoxX family protein [Bacteroidota bacterium]MDP4259627.1 DoxX family protein [Bacteroidota bacterium]
MLSKPAVLFFWILRILAALILLQTLFFKFSAAEESVYIFSTLGMEPWGRIGSGIIELIASILLLVPATTVIGALLGLGVMSGAVFFHLTRLGIEVKNDHGQLFIYALLVFFSCAILAWSYRRQLFVVPPSGFGDHR